MAAKGLEGIDETVQLTYSWLNEIAADLGSDRHGAYSALRAVLHTLRDRLTIDESAQFAAQLPMLVRGIYYEGWDPRQEWHAERDPETFLAQVGGEARLERGDSEWAVHAVSQVLANHVSAGEWNEVLAELPRAVRELLI